MFLAKILRIKAGTVITKGSESIEPIKNFTSSRFLLLGLPVFNNIIPLILYYIRIANIWKYSENSLNIQIQIIY